MYWPCIIDAVRLGMKLLEREKGALVIAPWITRLRLKIISPLKMSGVF
jgi:hypothetical protein